MQPWKPRKHVPDAEDPNALEGTASDPNKLSQSLVGKSPHLTLNIKGVIPTQTQLWVLTLLGITFQGVPLVFNGLVVYCWRLLRAGYVVAAYGYPLWAVGTAFITLGLCLCARVVESCTEESVVEPVCAVPSVPTANSSEDKEYVTRLRAKEVSTKLEDTGFCVRLQKKISSMNLGAFTIVTDENDPKVVISRRTVLPPGLNSTGGPQLRKQLCR